jgi:hypothetical protein
MRLNNIEILRRYSVELHRRVLLSVLTFTPVFEKSRSLAKVGHSVTARVSKHRFSKLCQWLSESKLELLSHGSSVSP